MTNKKEDSVEWREWTLGTYHLTAVVVGGPKYAKNREINVIEKAAFTALLSDYRELEDKLKVAVLENTNLKEEIARLRK